MDAILGHKPATQPHVVIDTSAEPDVEGWGSTQPTESTSNSQQEGSYLITPQQEPSASLQYASRKPFHSAVFNHRRYCMVQTVV